MQPHADYDQDFYAWIEHNVALLRCGQVSEVDAEHIAEELDSLGKRELRQLRSRLLGADDASAQMAVST